MIDLSLACEDANSKLVEVVTVADVEAEDHAGNIFLIFFKHFHSSVFDIMSSSNIVSLCLMTDRVVPKLLHSTIH